MAENFKKKLGDGKCAHCALPVARHGGMFYRVRVDMGVINVRALQRRQGLGMFLGSDALAEVMGPGEQIVHFTDENNGGTSLYEIRICTECFMERICLAQAVETSGDHDDIVKATESTAAGVEEIRRADVSELGQDGPSEGVTAGRDRQRRQPDGEHSGQ